MLVFLIVLCLPVVCAGDHEQNLIRQLNNFFDFDHNVFVLDSSVEINRFINTSPGQFTPQSLYVFESADADDDIVELKNLTEIASKNTFTIVVPKSAAFRSDSNLLTRVKEIQRLQINMKIGVFYPDIVSSDELLELFKWSWTQRIINIIAVTQSEMIQRLNSAQLLNVFSYNPFGTFEVINVTSESYDKFFISQNSDFQKYPFVLNETFTFKYRPQDETFCFTVLSVMNASFVEVQNDSTAMNENENRFYLQARPLALLEDEKSFVYPIEIIKMVIAVPEALPYSDITAYIRALTTYTLLGYCFLAISAVVLALSFFRFQRQRKFLFLQSVADVLKLLMNDNECIKYQQLSALEVFIIVPLTFAGLINVNGFLSALQSYLTRPVIQPQIDTIEDVYNSPYTWDDFWNYEVTKVLTNLSEHLNWTDKVQVMEYDLLFEQEEIFNTSMAFLREIKELGIYLRVQKSLNIRGYHISHLHISSELFAYLLDEDFPFIERVNEITHRIFSSGLFELWDRKYVIWYENYIVKNNLDFLNSRKETDVNKLELPMFIVYGWIASIIVLIIEIICKKCTFYSRGLKNSDYFEECTFIQNKNE